ncbi:MAG TPA: hypothetical protein VG056_14465 [Pirellulales bacterium]|jgi:hypothetical protein|nr:hypothetical protein [Pirellulales bacterium]
MDEHEHENPESDPRFPSGAWTGFYLQYWLPGRHTTNLHLTCHDGELAGTGSDRVGPYTIDGRYDLRTGQCEWTKCYIGKHSIAYRGINQGLGIWGVWELRQLGGLFVDRGGFHIWPEGADVGAESDEAEQALLAVMREEFGSRVVRAVRYLPIIAVIAIGLALLLRRFW